MIHSRPSAHPPRRGPFAAVSPIVRDKRPVLTRWGEDRRLVEAFPTVELPKEHPLRPYVDFELNDGRVIDCCLTKRSFSVTVEHFKVGSLAYAVTGKPSTSPEPLFPVTLEFLDVRELWVIQQRGIGDYRLLRSSLTGLRKVLFDVIAIRCVGPDAFALEFHGRGDIPEANDGCANEITVLLECGGSAVKENLEERWRQLVEGDTLELLQAYRRDPTSIWTDEDFDRFVAAHLP